MKIQDKGDIEDRAVLPWDIQEYISIKTDIFATFWAQRQAQRAAAAAAQYWSRGCMVLEWL